MNIEILTVNDHTKYIGRDAILFEPNLSSFVKIIRTTPHTAVIKHKNNELQKCLWGKLAVRI